jgi:hypothetical protein
MSQPQFVICIDNVDYPVSLEKRKIYEVVSDPDAEEIGHIRVVDESGDDYLYPATCFIDAHLPKEVQAAVVKAA